MNNQKHAHIEALLAGYEKCKDEILLRVKADHIVPVIVFAVFAAALAISNDLSTIVLSILAPFVIVGIFFFWVQNHYAMHMFVAYSRAIESALEHVLGTKILQAESTIAPRLDWTSRLSHTRGASIGMFFLVLLLFSSSVYFGMSNFDKLEATSQVSPRWYGLAVAVFFLLAVWSYARLVKFLRTESPNLTREIKEQMLPPAQSHQKYQDMEFTPPFV